MLGIPKTPTRHEGAADTQPVQAGLLPSCTLGPGHKQHSRATQRIYRFFPSLCNCGDSGKTKYKALSPAPLGFVVTQRSQPEGTLHL